MDINIQKDNNGIHKKTFKKFPFIRVESKSLYSTMQFKTTPEYVEITSDFVPLPKHGHLSNKTPEFAAAEPAINAAFAGLWALPDLPAIRAAAGDADAAMPPGGPDRYHDITTELIQFPARDGTLLELKVYKSLKVNQNATLMYRMHGGGKLGLYPT